MFVRVKKIGAYEYLYLVENAREVGRHVQRVNGGGKPSHMAAG
jgi:hypothetical protein